MFQALAIVQQRPHPAMRKQEHCTSVEAARPLCFSFGLGGSGGIHDDDNDGSKPLCFTARNRKTHAQTAMERAQHCIVCVEENRMRVRVHLGIKKFSSSTGKVLRSPD